MREIKFRVWAKQDKRWEDSSDFFIAGNGQLAKSEWDGTFDTDEDWYDICLYTGLRDENGKEIYEGDIVMEDIEKRTYQVVFSSGHFTGKSRDDKILIFGDGHVEVIGNIYENPEFLDPKIP